jgi:hypothetical protein
MNTEQALVEELARVTKERDEARAEVQRIKSQGAGFYIAQSRPEPSRLEIAAMLLAGWYASPQEGSPCPPSWWISKADALISAAEEAE